MKRYQDWERENTKMFMHPKQMPFRIGWEDKGWVELCWGKKVVNIMTKQAAICCVIQTFVLICWINLSNCPYLSICTCVSRTERVAGVISGYVFLRRFFYLTCPRPLHAVGRHQDPGVSERVITEVLMLWRQGNVIIHTIRVIVLVWERKWHWNLNHVNVHRSQPDEQVLYVFKKSYP